MSNATINKPASTKIAMNQSEESNPTIAQLNKLRQIIFTRDTALTFSQSIRLLFTLLKESLVLLWLALCYTLVALGWLGNKAIQSGQVTQKWVSTLRETSREQSPGEVAAETGRTVLDGSKVAIDYVMTQARKQVGLTDKND